MSLWNLSESAQKDARELRALLDQSTLIGSKKKICNLIGRLSDSGELAAITSVASGLFSRNPAIHTASSDGIATLLQLASSIELMRLSELLGGYYHGYISAEWAKIKPKYIKSYLQETNDVPVGCLLSLHKNGYVRQAAVDFLSGVESGDELRFLLFRQNDWVDSIASVAQSAILDRLTVSHLDRLIEEAELLTHLLHFQRRDLSAVVSKFVQLLTRPGLEAYLQRALRSSAAKTKRKLFDLLLARDGDHLPEVVLQGVATDDEVIRTKCLRRASGCLPLSKCNEIADSLLADKSVSVRVEAYELKAASSPKGSNDIWKRGLFDKSRAVRETAVFYLNKANFQVASTYREALSRFPDNLPALSGLVTSGNASDLPLFRSALDSPYASRRVEAIRGIGRVGGKSDVLRLQQSLTDESTRVVRSAHKQLSEHRVCLDPNELFCLIEKCDNLVGKTSILQLLIGLGKWSAMGFLVRASANGEEPLAEYSRTRIHQLFHENRVFTQPSTEQTTQIQTSLDQCVHALPANFASELRSYLSSYGFLIRV